MIIQMHVKPMRLEEQLWPTMVPVTTTGTSATAATNVEVMSIVRSKIIIVVREGSASAFQLHVLGYTTQCVDVMGEIIQMHVKPICMEGQL